MTRDNILALLNKAPYYSSTERDKKLYLSEREMRGRGGKTSVQTITRKLDEKNEVKVVGGIPNASIACCTTYQLHTGQTPLGNPICLEEVTKKIEPGKRSDVPCNKTY